MIAVIDSGVANLGSVMAALNRIDAYATVTTDATIIKKADKVILPGVGAAAPAMAQLAAKGLVELIRRLTQPVLGICLGMQLLFEHSSESGGVDGIGVFPGTLTQLPASADVSVPHMGWNNLVLQQPDHPLLHNIRDNDFVYYVHSFAAPVSAASLAVTDYGMRFTAIAGKDNFFGCQFHPERSGATGRQILQNFAAL